MAATAIWFLLQLIDLGIDFIWTVLPSMFGLRDSIIYNFAVCLIGGLLIGLWQKRNGPLPDNLETVIATVKKKGGYPYNRLHIIAIAAILPLIFGGSVGPEAGLAGLIAGFCCLIGDGLRYKGDRLATLAETGFAATLGVIFGAPLFGIIGNLEPDRGEGKYREKLVSKKTRIIIYCFGVVGAFASFTMLDRITGESSGLPRFSADHGMGLDQWKWFIPLFAVGLLFSLFYQVMNRLTKELRSKLGDRVIISCLIAGLCVALCGFFFPTSIFSGEDELRYLMDEWRYSSGAVMLLSAIVKLMLVNICISFGWRGGNIFPMIYSSALIGYSFALFSGMDGAFAVAVVTATLYAYVIKKPATAIAILLLCFPITYILPVGVSAILASKIPSPFKKATGAGSKPAADRQAEGKDTDGQQGENDIDRQEGRNDV